MNDDDVEEMLTSPVADELATLGFAPAYNGGGIWVWVRPDPPGCWVLTDDDGLAPLSYSTPAVIVRYEDASDWGDPPPIEEEFASLREALDWIAGPGAAALMRREA